MQPSAPTTTVTEGGDGSPGGDPGEPGGGGTGGANPTVEVCIELATGILERNFSVNVMTISSPSSTGKHITTLSLAACILA